MSIWNGLNRNLIEDQIKRLEIEAPVQDISSLPGLSPSSVLSGQPYPDRFLPFPVESQLTACFSLIAAWSNHPRDVSAVTLQHKTSPDSLLLSLATNEGIQRPVEEAFHSLVCVLKQCAARAPSKRNRIHYAHECLRIIVSLHRDRIFWRLGSKKAQGQRNDKAWPGMATRMRLLRTDKLKPNTRRPNCDAARLILQIVNLEAKVEVAEHCTPGSVHTPSADEVEALVAVILSAHEISSNDLTIITRLRRLCIPTNRREYRYIQALSNYWTISLYLSKVALRYPTWFARLTLNCLPVQITLKSQAQDYYVHAEMQLLLYHERYIPPFEPRYISASKQACFLCYCFIRAHGKYSIARSHGHVHHQWTVIVPEGIHPERRARLRDALRATALDVDTALQNATTTRDLRYNDPAQSVLQLVADQVRSPSQSTIESVVVPGRATSLELEDGDGSVPVHRLSRWRVRCKTYILHLCFVRD